MSAPLSARELLATAEREAQARVKAGKPAQLSPATIVDAAKSEATVYLFDAIGSWYGIDPREWVPAFSAIKAKTIHLRINSPGGSVFDAEAMKIAVAQHPAKVIAHIDGLCASAATGVAIAAQEVEMAAGAAFMIHDAWGVCAGGELEMLDYAALLRQATGNIVASYRLKTGKPEKQIRDWMKAESWFSASEALAHGFVDRIFTPGASNADTGRSQRERALALAEIQLNNFKNI